GARRPKRHRRVLRPLRGRGRGRARGRGREGRRLTRAPRPRPHGALLVSVRQRAHADARARDRGAQPSLSRRAETAPRKSRASADTVQAVTAGGRTPGPWRQLAGTAFYGSRRGRTLIDALAGTGRVGSSPKEARCVQPVPPSEQVGLTMPTGSAATSSRWGSR